LKVSLVFMGSTVRASVDPEHPRESVWRMRSTTEAAACP
jgi:hypothetical protein